MNMLDGNINYVEKGKSLTIQAFTDLYESDFDSMWKSIPWDKITRHIFDLQERIFRVVKEDGDYRRARTLENLLLKSDSVLLYSGTGRIRLFTACCFSVRQADV